MFARGRSKDRSNRKSTPPQASYMDSDQFANYLTELREKRVTRPGGAKTAGASSAPTSIDPGGSAARTPATASTTTLNPPPAPPFPRADSALSNRTTTTILSHAPTRPSMSTSRSRRSMPPPASPQDEKKFANIDPTIVQPSATYIERGQRWMEREEAGSLRDALEDMDAAERKKAEEAASAEEKLRELAMKEEERIQLAAQKEASELVFAHLHPEEVKRRQEDEERRRQTGYRYHLRKGSYQHARAASVGREYKGDDAIIVDLNSRPRMPSRTFSDESTMRSASRTSMRRESSDHSSRPSLENRQSTDEPRGRPPAKSNGKSYGILSTTFSGVASTSRSWSARRKSGGGKRNISGEINTVFHPDQIWEEPETSRESSKNRAKKEQAEKSKEDMYNGTEPLSPLKRNPANRVQFQEEIKRENTTLTLQNAGLPVQKIDRFEIFRNPPSQSRNPLYTANDPPKPRTPSPDKNLPDLHMKDGKEIRNEELRKATTKSLKERSEKLPTPTAVSDNRGRPIVSFDKKWMPAEEKAALEKEKEKALLDLVKNKADSTPAGTTRTIIAELIQGGEIQNESATSTKTGTTGLSAVEIAKRKIFGLAEETSFGGPKSFRERTSRSCSPQRRSGEGTRERGRKEGEGGEKGKEEERQGYFEVVGCPADEESVLGKIGHAGPLTGKNDADADAKVSGKWIVETRNGVSTFRIEDEKTLKEQQRRKDGFPYRLDSSANSSTSSFAAANPRPTSRDGSKKSTPRTSVCQEKLEADIKPTSVATTLVGLLKNPLSAAPIEPAKEKFPSLETSASVPASLALTNCHAVSVAPPAAATRPTQIERQSTLMARSPFARPRGESFMSRRSIFQPEKSVPASPPLGNSNFLAMEKEKPKPIGPSLLCAPRPRPSFLTRTRSRSSVSGHSVFALKKPEPTIAASAPIKKDQKPLVEEQKPSPPAQTSPDEKSTEEVRPPIFGAGSSENSTLRALLQPPMSSTDTKQAPSETPKPTSKVVQLAAPFGQSLLSAARPRPSFLTRTRSRSSVARHSVFALKKTEPVSAPALTPPAKEEPKPPAVDETPTGTSSPLAEFTKASMEEVRPLMVRAKSSDVSVSRALPPLPPAEIGKETPSPTSPVAATAPSISAPAAEIPRPINHITNSHLSKLNTRPSFLTRTRSRSSVAGHAPYSLKGQESSSPLAETSSPTLPAHEEDRPPIARAKSSENSIPKAVPRQSSERAPPPRLNTRSPFARSSPGPRSLPVPSEMSLDNDNTAPSAIASTTTPISAPELPAEAPKPINHITNSHLSTARSRPSFLTRTRSRSSVAGHSPYSLKGEESFSPVAESSNPTPPAHDEDRPPFNRSKSSENTIRAMPRPSIEEQDKPGFAPRSPFTRPSLGPTSLSTPTEMALNKMGSVASRSPFGRPGGPRSSMSTVSVPSSMKEIGPSPSVRRSPFDRPVTSHGSTPHARSSLGTEVRNSIDDGDARPKSRDDFSANSAKAKLPWMRANRGSADENVRPRSSTTESFKIESASERPVSRGKELPSMKKSTAPEPEKILPGVGVTVPRPPSEVTVNTADVAALYQDVFESPTKAPEVVVKTADIAEQYDLVLNESKPSDEKAIVTAPAAPVIPKAPEVAIDRTKSSLSGARPLPMRPSGPRQSAPSARRTPRHEDQGIAPPPLVKAQTAPKKVIPPPQAAIEPSPEKKGHKKSTSSISAPSAHAAVLAPPVETLSEVRPPAPEDAVMEQKPLPTIYGPPRPETPSGLPSSLGISTPAIAIRAPSPAPPSDAPMISVLAPAINVSEPSVPTVSAPPRQQSNRPLPQPTRPLPQPGSSARPLPRPTSSSDHRPLPAPANARPMPSPSSRVAPPPNLARPSSDSTSHWSPAPAPAGSRATATCHACNLPIEGRVIALAGLKERWHPACMQCHVCSTALADFEISPEPAFARKARIARIEAREAGDYVQEGETTDGDKKLRFYCHLDWHEAFAPRCQHCKTPIIGEHITALGGKHYHYGHFFCCECGDPFNQGVPHVELDGYAWCTGCVEKRTLRRAPKCGLCRKNVVGEVVQALGKEFHAGCFRCGDCGDAFVGGEIYLRDDVGVSCRECMERWAKNQRRGSVRG